MPRKKGTLAKAAARSALFKGKPPQEWFPVNIPDPPENSVMLGEITEIVYRTKKAGDKKPIEYAHKFRNPRPVLLTDPDGKNLFIAEGGFKITERGIVG